MIECSSVDALVEARIDRVWTQYRESPKLLAMMRAYLGQIAEINLETCATIGHFELDTAVGDQLTIIGNALGWPRCHCRGQRRPIFGFECIDECGPPSVPVAGFCQAEWDCGNGPEFVEFCFADDDLYRGFVKARRWAVAGDYTHHGITRAARDVFGPTAVIFEDGEGVIEIAAGRLLNSIEISIAHLYEQCLPIPPGVRLKINHSNGVPFGFGEGWGGFCDGAYTTPITLN